MSSNKHCPTFGERQVSSLGIAARVSLTEGLGFLEPTRLGQTAIWAIPRNGIADGGANLLFFTVPQPIVATVATAWMVTDATGTTMASGGRFVSTTYDVD